MSLIGIIGQQIRRRASLRKFTSIFTESTGSVQFANDDSEVFNNLKLQNFSIEFYVNIYSNIVNFAGGISHGLIYSTSYSWYISFVAGNISITAADSSSSRLFMLQIGDVLNLNTEYKIKIKINNGTVEMYVNDALSSSTTFSGSIDYDRSSLETFDSFTLGGRPSPINTLAFDGSLDEVVITDLDTGTIKFNSQAVYSGVDSITGDTGVITDVTEGVR